MSGRHNVNAKSEDWGRKRIFFACFVLQKIKKNIFFEKRTGEVIENTGKGYIDSRKRTGNEPESEAEKLLKTRSRGKNEPERTGKRTGPCC
jgi:hypothetical protein